MRTADQFVRMSAVQVRLDRYQLETVMNGKISRRTLLTAGPLALTACETAHGAYFGKTEPPATQRLIYEIGGEPETLDPAKTAAGAEVYVIPSLFEPLIYPHPTGRRPLAGIATHYEAESNHTRYIFYLRGHPKPRGVSLPGTDSLRREYLQGVSSEDLSRGLPPSPHGVPARWSDGTPVTAHDFVYSWRRSLDPATACPLATFLFCVRFGEEINAGRRPPTELGVSAPDDYTLRVELRSPTPYFVEAQEDFACYAVPQHVVEMARRNGTDWTHPARIVTSGPFTVGAWKPYDNITLIPNPHYYDAHLVALREIVLLPVVSTATNLNIYKAGGADSMLSKVVAPSYIPLLRSKRDFEAAPAYWTMFYSINTRRAPFDNPLVRYALNMAIDKNAIARLLRAGQLPAAGLLPPLEGYKRPLSLPVNIDGRIYDVLSYDPPGARRMLEIAGCRRLRIEILYPMLPASQDVPLVLQRQWRDMLGAEVVLKNQELAVCIQNRNALQYTGVAERGWWGAYLDPNTFLETFLSGPSVIGTGWSDPAFDALLADANAAPTSALRMARLAECEKLLLRAMPVLPLYYNVQAVLKKPYVRGLPVRNVDGVRFKYAGIDRNWRPS